MISFKENILYRRLSLYNIVRIAILVVLIVIGLVVYLIADIEVALMPVIIFFGISILLSLALFFVFKKVSLIISVYVQLVLDIIIITMLVYFSGGITSPFYFLYVLPIIISAIFLSKRGVIYIATLCYILFGTLSDLIYLKIIPNYLNPDNIHISFGDFLYNLILSLLAFSSIALLSSFYYGRIRRSGVAIQNLQEDLKELNVFNNAVMDKIDNGFVISNAEGKIISYNYMAKKMLNIKILEVDVFQLLGISNKKKEIFKEVLKSKKVYFENKLGKTVLGISVSVIKGVYSFDLIYAFVLIDLTEKKEVENLLKQKENFSMIGRMAAGIAHELRNPLASISGSAQFLSRELELKDLQGYKDLLDIIVNESNRLSEIIEEFLQFSKSEKLKKEKFDVFELLQEIIKLLSLNKKNVEIRRYFNRGFLIKADKNKIKQLFWNLLSNAVKAVHNNGIIEVSLFSKEDRQFMSIKDYGIGLSEDEKKKLFKPFYSKFTSGIGLGMFMVKKIVDEHGFEIKIISSKNIGTEVIVCLTEK